MMQSPPNFRQGTFVRTPFHSVISILGFVSCGLNFIYSLLNIVKHFIFLGIENSNPAASWRNFSVYLLFFQIGLLVLNVFSLIGILKMYNGKKQGLWWYIIGESVPWVLFLILFISGGKMLAGGALLVALFGGGVFLVFFIFLLGILFLMDILFIVFYALVKFNQPPVNFPGNQANGPGMNIYGSY